MKHYAHILICTASLACACSFCGCRATYQNDSSTQEQTRLSISDSALRIRTEDACSRFKLNQEEAGKGWKVKVNFDTSKRQIRRPAYPRYRISRLKGTKRQSRPCYRKMTLYTYLRVKKRRMISRFSKANSQPPTKMPAVL